MTHALSLDSRQLALELYELLRDIDPARWRNELEEAARERLQRIEQQLTELTDSPALANQKQVLKERYSELARVMREHMPSPGLSNAALREEWMSFRNRLVPAYDALAVGLRAQAIHVPSLRPTNYGRNLFHFASATTALLCTEMLLNRTGLIVVAAGMAVTAWTLETLRRGRPQLNRYLMRFFGPIAHPHEHHRVNSATWYLSALLALSLTGSYMLCGVALAVLGVGDPMAALVGRRWGRHTLIHGRSVEGTLAFVGVSALAALGTLQIWHRSVPLPLAILVACGAALAGATAELVSKRLDDNLTIPLSAAAGAWATSLLLGVPL